MANLDHGHMGKFTLIPKNEEKTPGNWLKAQSSIKGS